MILTFRPQLRDADGEVVRRKDGQIAYDEPWRPIEIVHDGVMVVRSETAVELERTRSFFERLANGLGCKLDIGTMDTKLNPAHDPDPKTAHLEGETNLDGVQLGGGTEPVKRNDTPGGPISKSVLATGIRDDVDLSKAPDSASPGASSGQ